MAIAELTSRTIAIGLQSALGTIAGTGDGKYQNFRPDTSGGLTKDSFESDSIRRDQQYSNPRHGLRQGAFALSQELQIGGHNDLFAGLLRNAWAAGATTGVSTDMAVDATARTITRTGGSFVTDGFKVGDIVRFATSGSGTAGNENVNLRLTNVTALVLTYANDPWTSVMTTDAAGDSVTLSAPGAKLSVPSSAHTKDYFTIDDWHDDISQGTRITDAIVNSVEMDISPGAHATATFNMLGVNADLDNNAEYFVAADAAPTGALLAGPEGKLRYDGADSAVMTQISLTIDSGGEAKAVIGANVSPDIFRLGVRATGSLAALFDGDAILDNFDDEAEASLFVYLFADSTASSEFLIIKLPNVKINSADKASDGPAQVLSGEFSAGKYVGASTVIEGTSVVLVDSTVTP
jgi:hypothetical protein